MTATESKISDLIMQCAVKQTVKPKSSAENEKATGNFKDLLQSAVSDNSNSQTAKSDDNQLSELNAALESGDTEKAIEAIEKLPEDEQGKALEKLLKSLFGELPEDTSLLQLLAETGVTEQIPEKLMQLLTAEMQAPQVTTADGINAVKQKIVDYSAVLKEQMQTGEPVATAQQADEQAKVQTVINSAQEQAQMPQTQQTANVQTLQAATVNVLAQTEQADAVTSQAMPATQNIDTKAIDNNITAGQNATQQNSVIPAAITSAEASQGKNQAEQQTATMQFTAVSTEADTEKSKQTEDDGFENLLEQTQGTQTQQTAQPHILSNIASQTEKLVDSQSQLQGRIDLIQQLTARISAENAKNQSEFVMQLQPKELGTVVIKMALNGDKLNVNIFTDNANTQRLMQNQVAELEQSLKSQNNQIVTVNVQNESFNQMMASDNGTNYNSNHTAGNRFGSGRGNNGFDEAAQAEDEAQRQDTVVTMPTADSLLNSIA